MKEDKCLYNEDCNTKLVCDKVNRQCRELKIWDPCQNGTIVGCDPIIHRLVKKSKWATIVGSAETFDGKTCRYQTDCKVIDRCVEGKCIPRLRPFEACNVESDCRDSDICQWTTCIPPCFQPSDCYSFDPEAKCIPIPEVHNRTYCISPSLHSKVFKSEPKGNRTQGRKTELKVNTIPLIIIIAIVVLLLIIIWMFYFYSKHRQTLKGNRSSRQTTHSQNHPSAPESSAPMEPSFLDYDQTDYPMFNPYYIIPYSKRDEARMVPYPYRSLPSTHYIYPPHPYLDNTILPPHIRHIEPHPSENDHHLTEPPPPPYQD